MEIEFKKIDQNFTKEASVVFIAEETMISSFVKTLDGQFNNIISQTIEKGYFKAKFGELKSLTLTDSNNHAKIILLVGVGKSENLELYKVEELGGKIYQGLCLLRVSEAEIIANIVLDQASSELVAEAIKHGIALASYKFDKYKTQNLEQEQLKIKNISISYQDFIDAEKLNLDYEALTQGVYLARDLVSEPANKKPPEIYAAKISEE